MTYPQALNKTKTHLMVPVLDGGSNGQALGRFRDLERAARPQTRLRGMVGLAIPALLSLIFLLAAIFSVRAADMALDDGDAVITGFSGIAAPSKPIPPGSTPLDHFFIDLDGASAQILSLVAPGGRPDGQLISAPPKLRIKARDVGQVFAIALAKRDARAARPDIYLGATSVFGVQIVLPDSDGDGRPERAKTGHPNAMWMPGQFGSGGPGGIYRVDAETGAVSLFATLPGNSGPGIADIAYDPATRQFFVSDLDSGMTYRLDQSGTVIESFDHGMTGRSRQGLAPIADDGRAMTITDLAFDSENADTWGLTQKERRVHGLAVSNGRLFYAVASGPQIWSIGLNGDGSFAADPRLEIDVDVAASTNAITSLTFDAKGMLYAAQRGDPRGSYKYARFAEPAASEVLRFRRKQAGEPGAGDWSQVAERYAIGLAPAHKNATGGVALGYGYDDAGVIRRGVCDAFVWSTGEALAKSTEEAAQDDVQGVQGNETSRVRPENVPPRESYFADYDGQFGDAEKAGHVGAVRIWQACDGVREARVRDLPPGFLPPITLPPLPPFVAPDFHTNLRIDKRPLRKTCTPWGAGFFCAFEVRVTNTGPDVYVGPILITDFLPAAPAGALMGFSPTPPWVCGPNGAASYQCLRPATVLFPGGSVSVKVGVFVPKSYKLCHVQNVAHINWAPGSSQWNVNPFDDVASTTALIPAEHCKRPEPKMTNLKIEKDANPDICSISGGDVVCRFLITVTNIGGVYNGPITVKDTLPAGVSVTAFSAPWACAGGNPAVCTHPAVMLNDGQKVFLWIWAKMPKNVARALQCRVPNSVKITAAPGGTPQNTDASDDDANATADVPGNVCLQTPVPSQECPAGFKWDGQKCDRGLTEPCRGPRCGEEQPPRLPIPPFVPPVDRGCPEGTSATPVRGKCCPLGTRWNGRQCIKPEKPDCPDDTVGKYPNCRPVIQRCPEGTVGRFPDCRRKEQPRVCPEGTKGRYPNCRPIPSRTCPQGTVGSWPTCRKIVRTCPSGFIGRYPFCRKPARINVCPQGTVGRHPNCRLIPSGRPQGNRSQQGQIGRTSPGIQRPGFGLAHGHRRS